MKGDGVSEVIGAIILISVAVLAMGIVILFLFAGPLPTSVPAFSGLISNSSQTVYISHEGGDTLYTGQFKILVDGVDETYNFTKSLSGPFSLGKVMSATLPNMPGRVVMVFNTSWGGGTVLLSADLVHVVPFTPAGWYSSNWIKRKKITINPSKVSGSLTDFPVLISIADLRLQNYAQNDGDDILFTSGGGTAPLAHEIEYYNNNGGILVAWVKVPSVTSASDTVIYIYYNNSAASNQEDKTGGVWSNGYQAVWHLKEVGTGYPNDYNDSSMNGNNGWAGGGTAGAYPTQTTGQIGYGQSFDGASDYIATNKTVTSPPTAFTLSTWFETATAASGKFIGLENNQKGTGSGSQDWTLYIGNNGYVVGGIYGGGAVRNVNTSPTTYNDDYPHYAVLTYSSSPTQNLSLYVDGNYIGSKTGYAPQTLTGYLRMGSYRFSGLWPYSAAGYYSGLLDEVRYSSVGRSSDWILTEYNNQNDPGTFLSLSTEQTQTTMS